MRLVHALSADLAQPDQEDHPRQPGRLDHRKGARTLDSRASKKAVTYHTACPVAAPDCTRRGRFAMAVPAHTTKQQLWSRRGINDEMRMRRVTATMTGHAATLTFDCSLGLVCSVRQWC